MKFIDVYSDEAGRRNAARILYRLLEERPEYANISHKSMPTWEQHVEFKARHPYQSWMLIEVDDEIVGAIYLSRQDEIGIGIFNAHQGKGHASRAIALLMRERGPRRFLANIAPANEPSHKLFEKLGFRLIQHTYSLEAK
jgi:RimJ/RimL family protein N-acetyltransferase